MKFCQNFADNLENVEISEIFEFSMENSYFERIRMVRIVRMVRMVRFLADRTFQLCRRPRGSPGAAPRGARAPPRRGGPAAPPPARGRGCGPEGRSISQASVVRFSEAKKARHPRVT